MQINQVVVTASPRDAVTNSAFAYRELLRRAGPSEIFALHIDADLSDEVVSIREWEERTRPARSTDDVLIYHVSIGSPDVFGFVRERPEQLVVVYHNISPASAYRSFDPRFAELLDVGRRELAALRDACVLAIAPSEYNASELRTAGYDNVHVVPLIIDAHRLRTITPSPTITADLARVEGPVLLFVGQLLPHKRPDFLLEAFHFLRTHLRTDASLFVVGAARLEQYKVALDRFKREANLVGATLLPAIPDEELVALFRRADVFVTASEHEGFCVPLVEAMAFDVPVVARSFGAIPETVADAGVVIGPCDGPLVFAEAVAEVLDNHHLREVLVRRGRARVDHFDAKQAAAGFLRLLLTLG